MKSTCRLGLGCLLGAFCLSVIPARAQESPLGLYIGAGGGPSNIRQGPDSGNDDFGVQRETVGWDAFLGIRPLPYLGAEIEYLDFGGAHQNYYGIATPYASNGDLRLHESAEAPAAFAVGYLPIGSWWDLYLKAGTARLHKSWDLMPPTICSSPGPCVYASFPGGATNWDFAYGVGAQWKLGTLAFRLEYQRVNAAGSTAGGDPDLLSFEASWRLF